MTIFRSVNCLLVIKPQSTVTCAIDETEPLGKFICGSLLKSLFWAPTCLSFTMNKDLDATSQKLLNGVRLHLLHRLHYCCCCQQFDFLRACLLFPCNTRTILKESTNYKAMMGMGTCHFFTLLLATKLLAFQETQ